MRLEKWTACLVVVAACMAPCRGQDVAKSDDATSATMIDPSQVVIAEWEGGRLTLADARARLKDVFDVDSTYLSLEEPRSQAQFDNLMQEAVFQDILFSRANADNLRGNEEFRNQLENARRDAMLSIIWEEKIRKASIPSEEEILAHLDSVAATRVNPAEVSFRFMMFEARKGSDEATVNEAMQKANKARASLLGGKDFSEVAAKLASPPVNGNPGDIIGPIPMSDRLPKVVSDALMTVPIGSVSEVLRTDSGLFLIKVEGRSEERRPKGQDLRNTEGLSWINSQRDEYFKTLVNRLKEERAAVFTEPTEDMAKDAVVVSTKDCPPLTKEAFDRRAGSENPELARQNLAKVDPRTGLPHVLSEQLLLCEFGQEAAPEKNEATAKLLAKLEREKVIEWMRRGIAEPPAPEPSPEQLKQYYDTHPSDFLRKLYSVSTMKISTKTMEEATSSTAKLVFFRKGEEIVAGIKAGKTFEEAARELPGWGRPGDKVEEQKDVKLDSVPVDFVNDVAEMTTGTIARPVLLPMGVGIVRLNEKKSMMPPFEESQDLARRLWVRSQPGKKSARDLTLEEAKVVWHKKGTDVHWDSSGNLQLR